MANVDRIASPRPGSCEAIAQGCLCPHVDNHHGAGVQGLGREWWFNAACPVHRAEFAALLARKVEVSA